MIKLRPLRFQNDVLEKGFRDTTNLKRSKRDRHVLLPWALLWVGILARNYRRLTLPSVAKSSMSFICITSPVWLQLILHNTTYLKYRAYITSVAKLAFVLHAGGGIYRAGLAGAPQTAFPLFVQLLMASRVLFWLVLQFGYSIDWLPSIIVEGVLVWKMSQGTEPFCRYIHASSSKDTLLTIAASIPQMGVVPLPHSELRANVNVCLSLMLWLQIGLGALLPVVARLVEDCWERQQYAKLNPQLLTEMEKRWWLWDNIEWIPGLSVVVFFHLWSLLWWVLIRTTPTLDA